MATQFQLKADASSDLVVYEKFLDDFRNQKRNEITSQYLDLVDWLMMLQRHPYIDMPDEMIKQVQNAYIQTNKIQSSIDNQESNLKSQRDEIERRLQIETKAFSEELNDIKSQVDKFKDNYNRKKEEDYNKQIDKINKTLATLSERMKKINDQEQDLEATPSEWPQIDICKK
jgi:uncharacterized protein YukE